MASFANGKIEAFVGPAGLGGPDDLEAAIIDFIGGAKESLDIAVQELDSRPIAEAILDARWGGVDVRICLEQDYLREGRMPARPTPQPGETQEEANRRAQWQERKAGFAENRRIVSALLASRIDVKPDYNPKIFHQKFVLRDFRPRSKGSPTAALLSGSANFTETDTHRNLNHVFVFHDKRVCGEYMREFEQIRSGSFGRGAHGDVPRAYSVEGVPVKICFAPDHTPELEIVKQMLRCKRRLDFAIFTFAGSSGIDDAMLMLAAANREITGALDPGQAKQRWAAPRAPGAAPEWLEDPRIKLFVPKREPGGLRKLHHKLMVIDDAVVVGGSMNYTAPANEYNDENIFVIGSPYEDLPKKEGGPVDLARCAEITAYLRKEIERIIAGSERYRP